MMVLVAKTTIPHTNLRHTANTWLSRLLKVYARCHLSTAARDLP